MSKPDIDVSRRRFLNASIAVGLALPLPAMLGREANAAEPMPQLDEAEPTAKALRYVHDASQVDAATRGGDDRLCRSCRFYTDATAEPWGPCSLFPGKAVNANGWCSGWVARTN